MMKLIGTDRFRGFKFKYCSRFIDDACNLNDAGEFASSYKEIYPPELDLKCEHSGFHATFLELDITIKNDQFIYKLFDKRDEFPFEIVRMPDNNGNIPSHIFYGSIFSEILRIARATLLYSDFIERFKSLYRRMINQGACENNILKLIDKVVNRYPKVFTSFNTSSFKIKNDITS